jgi:hypothetical protein
MRYATIALALLIAGCAADSATPPLAANHPANPAAPTAPLEGFTALAAITAPATQPTSQPATKPQTAGNYVCPMHEHVTSDDPNARCPICGMRLVLRKGVNR